MRGPQFETSAPQQTGSLYETKCGDGAAVIVIDKTTSRGSCAQCAGLHVTFLGQFVLFVVAVGALSVTITERSHDRTTSSRLPLGIALSCSLAAILALTLVPAPGANERHLVPFVHIIGGLRPPTATDVLLDVVGNALLLLPLGAGLGLLGFRVRTTVLIAFSLSALVEITQLFVPGRTTSVDDVLLNTLGALLGHALLLRWAPVADV